MLVAASPHAKSRIILPLPRTRTGFGLVGTNGVQHDLVDHLLVIGRVALAPFVADGIGEDISIAVEGRGRDGPADSRVALEAMLSVLIPEVEGAVAARGAEGTMHRMEVDRVHGVDIRGVAGIGRGFAVALEREVRGGILLLDVLDCAAALDAANGKPGCIREAADDPRLPLERGLHGLVELGRVVQVDDVDVPVRRADYQQLVLHVHRVNALLALELRDGRLLS